ncbi:alpha/beta hydrolase family protein [Pseudoalteromonas xiamenensis]
MKTRISILFSALCFTQSAFSETPNEQVLDVLSQSVTLRQASIAPDGKHLAFGVNSEGESSIAVLELPSFRPINNMKMGSSFQMGDFFWANNTRLISQVRDKLTSRERPVDTGNLYAFDFDGRNGKMIFGGHASQPSAASHIKKAPTILGLANFLDPLPQDENQILLRVLPATLNAKGSSAKIDGSELAKIARIDVNNGVIRSYGYQAPIAHAQYVLNEDKKPILVSGMAEDLSVQTYLFNSDEKEWKKLELPGNFEAFQATENDKFVVGIAGIGEEKRGIYKLNLKTLQLEKVFSDEKYDVIKLYSSIDKKTVIGAQIASPLPTYILLDKTHPDAQILKSAINTFPNEQVSLFNKTEDGSQALIWAGSDKSDGSLYLFDIKNQKIRYLYSFREAEKQLPLTDTTPISFTTSDGINLEGFYTQALETKKGKTNKLVVLVHGGPFGVRDTFLFDPEVHLLAQHGYNVLRVNFRGSGGRGEAFEALGYQKWGTDIQRDIYEGVQWAIKEKGIAANKVCIMGTSFGGYSAVMNPIRYPDTYQCAIANAGVYDLSMLYEEGDVPRIYSGKSFLHTTLGTDQAMLAENSPSKLVDKLSVPLLLAHGRRDSRAPLEHFEVLTDALNKEKKPYTVFLGEKEGHGFYSETVRKDYFKTVLAFLNQHLDD